MALQEMQRHGIKVVQIFLYVSVIHASRLSMEAMPVENGHRNNECTLNIDGVLMMFSSLY